MYEVIIDLEVEKESTVYVDFLIDDRSNYGRLLK
jgi:hypothetical protein